MVPKGIVRKRPMTLHCNALTAQHCTQDSETQTPRMCGEAIAVAQPLFFQVSRVGVTVIVTVTCLARRKKKIPEVLSTDREGPDSECLLFTFDQELVAFHPC